MFSCWITSPYSGCSIRILLRNFLCQWFHLFLFVIITGDPLDGREGPVIIMADSLDGSEGSHHWILMWLNHQWQQGAGHTHTCIRQPRCRKNGGFPWWKGGPVLGSLLLHGSQGLRSGLMASTLPTEPSCWPRGSDFNIYFLSSNNLVTLRNHPPDYF